MFINAQIDLLFSEKGLDIRLRDQEAGVLFAELHLNQEQTCQAMSRLSGTHVEKCEIRGLNRVGKKIEIDSLEFPMPKNVEFKNRAKVAYEIAKEKCDEGWVPDAYFGSQDSFSTDKNNTLIAKATIRRWVEKE